MTFFSRPLGGGLLTVLLVASTLAGCGKGDTDGPNGNTIPSRPFPSHPTYTPGSARPTGDQAALDTLVKDKYLEWKKYYLVEGCGGYYVVTEGGAGKESDDFVTNSEGHGYGMMITVLMAGVDPDARKIFDGFVALRDRFPSSYDNHLQAWGMTGKCQPPKASENDAATDGDLDAAFALLLAEKQWNDPYYGRRAKEIIAAIKLREMHPGTKLPLLGDWAMPSDTDLDSYTTTRLSDHMPDHFRAFAKATGDTFWDEAVAAVYKLISGVQEKYAPSTGLLPDFVKKTSTDPVPVPIAEANDPEYLSEDLETDFAYNACRVGWRLGTDFVVSGDATAKGILGKMNTFIKTRTNGDASKIVDGYNLDGMSQQKAPAPNLCFTGGFGVASLTDQANQAWVDSLWKELNTFKLEDYYPDTIRLINMIVMSGNWWAP